MRTDLQQLDKSPKEVDRMELLIVLGRIYAKCSVYWTPLNLREIVKTNNAPTVRTKVSSLVSVLVRRQYLLRRGTNGHSYEYIWNRKIGPPTLPMCSELIEQIKEEGRRVWREKYAKKVQKEKELRQLELENIQQND